MFRGWTPQKGLASACIRSTEYAADGSDQVLVPVPSSFSLVCFRCLPAFDKLHFEQIFRVPFGARSPFIPFPRLLLVQDPCVLISPRREIFSSDRSDPRAWIPCCEAHATPPPNPFIPLCRRPRLTTAIQSNHIIRISTPVPTVFSSSGTPARPLNHRHAWKSSPDFHPRRGRDP